MRIGIDFGGTKIEAAAIDADGAFAARVRAATPADYDGALAAVRKLIERVEREVGQVRSVGIGIPGSASPRSGLIRNANTVYLNGRPFAEDLARVLARPVRVANDANCFAISEAVDGAGRDARTVFGAILGTGCGGGVVVDGRLLEGRSGVAGEWGHSPLPNARGTPVPCWCGLEDCLEVWISGSGLSRDYAAGNGPRLRGEEIVAAAGAGQAAAVAAFDAYVERLARALAGMIHLIDPDVIVLGGGMSNVEALYARLPDAIRAHVFGGEWDAPVRRAHWGDSSGVRGAAWLWE